ncbi:MAG: NAD(P)-dependent alcohol dehydrogenase [Sulfobacillus benefaciens]|jgi:L-iditol 2-dehydrogenase|uniref:NAD(P)-dependent alcohol dehydrogenase n=1 Tax=Sulfobacillus benefaciens TaxID=453960 RepID=A0A2T2WUN4_9FIRM|nr:MAG: NAD(P)-dependent alcohol dehydrogenase [Sulfobacillus benefaciens]HBQ94088.1 NAD(P)-dependent alcohol dehydrogenase [Sulfobacillus sp.]
MLAAVLKAPHCLEIEDRDEVEDIPAGFVRVAMKSVGICGSDVHYYQEGRIADFVVRQPMVLGHESAGIIDGVGNGVALQVGQVVALEPGIPCGRCQYCRTGVYNLCPEVKFFATPPIDGALQQYVLHPASFTFPADDLSPDEACLAEPLSVGVYAVREAEIALGHEILVIGAGPVGLATAFAAESQGARVNMIDINPERLEMARQAGFEAMFSSYYEGKQFDVVFECTGTQDGIHGAQSFVRTGGMIALIGMGQSATMQLESLDIIVRGIKVVGVFRYANTYPNALALIRRYRERLRIFQSNRISLLELPRFLATKQYEHHIKTIVSLN